MPLLGWQKPKKTHQYEEIKEAYADSEVASNN